MPSLTDSRPAARGMLDAYGDREAQIAANGQLLARAEAAAERLHAGGHSEDAVAATAVGAHVAAFLHPGIFASERMESVLRAIAAEHLAPLPARERVAEPRRVLHVATETYGIGGHTRAIMRWIGRDAGRVHSVATTAQVAKMPEALIAATEATGGSVMRLHPGEGWIGRARTLREMAASADVVVLHCHHRDPIPVLAFADAGGTPPVITFNHADHMFWLGYSVTDLLLCVRDLPAHGRRGIAAERVARAPLPVLDGREPAGEGERAAARAAVLRGVGWPDDATVLLSVGNQIKFDGPAGTTLPDLVEPVLADLPGARLLAIGAVGVPDFDRFVARSGGRVVALDRVDPIAPAFLAADVYLESRPGGGGTATAEAASYSLPCLSHAATDLEATMMCTDSAYGNRIARSAGEYRAELLALVADPAHRAEAGARAREAVLATDAAWAEGVAGAYARAAELGPVDPAELAEPPRDGHPIHVLTDFFQQMTAAYHEPVDLEAAVMGLELTAQTRALRQLYVTLAGRDSVPELLRQYEVAFAAPAADPDSLRTVVEEFRRLARVRAADRFVLALRGEDADAAVPVLEEALSAGPDVDVDLVLGDDPWAMRPPFSLAVVPGEGPGDLAGPVHRCEPRPAAAVV